LGKGSPRPPPPPEGRRPAPRRGPFLPLEAPLRGCSPGSRQKAPPRRPAPSPPPGLRSTGKRGNGPEWPCRNAGRSGATPAEAAARPRDRAASGRFGLPVARPEVGPWPVAGNGHRGRLHPPLPGWLRNGHRGEPALRKPGAPPVAGPLCKRGIFPPASAIGLRRWDSDFRRTCFPRAGRGKRQILSAFPSATCILLQSFPSCNCAPLPGFRPGQRNPRPTRRTGLVLPFTPPPALPPPAAGKRPP